MSEMEAEAKLRKELGLSPWGMVENTFIPWRIRILLEWFEKVKRENKGKQT